MHEMMTRNPGLKSRFTEYFDFCDWTPEMCADFVMQNLFAFQQLRNVNNAARSHLRTN